MLLLCKGFLKLKILDLSHVLTQEPARVTDLAKQELAHKATIESVESFDKSGMSGFKTCFYHARNF